MEPLPVYILAGGRSSRFGSDKARALLHGEPLMVRLARQVRSSARSIVVIADRDARYEDLELETIADLHPGLGPLAGLERALVDARERHADFHGHVLLLSCDMADVRREWIESLHRAATGSESEASGPVGFAGFRSDDRGHPIPGLYAVSILSAVQARLAEAADRSMRSLIRAVSHRWVDLPPDWPEIPQINTRDDLAAVEARLRPPES